MDILLNGQICDALSIIVHKTQAEKYIIVNFYFPKNKNAPKTEQGEKRFAYLRIVMLQ